MSNEHPGDLDPDGAGTRPSAGPQPDRSQPSYTYGPDTQPPSGQQSFGESPFDNQGPADGPQAFGPPDGRPNYGQPIYGQQSGGESQRASGQQSDSEPPSGQQPFNQRPHNHQPCGQQPYGQDPYGQQPFGAQDPYAQDPYGHQPYGQQPYAQDPYGQQPFGAQDLYAQDPYAKDPYRQQPHGQEPYGPPPHAQESYPQEPYGQQPYPQEPYGQQPYGQQQSAGFAPYASGYGAGAPARKSWLRRFWPVIAGVVGLLLVLGLLSELVTRASDSGTNHTLSAPARSGGYTKQSGALADRVAASASSSMQGRFSQQELRTGLYATSGAAIPEFVFLGVQSTQLADRPAASTIDSFMTGANVSNAGTVDPGALGGKMKCGVSSENQTTCAWVDHNTLGALVFVTLKGAEAEGVARTFRGDAEK